MFFELDTNDTTNLATTRRLPIVYVTANFLGFIASMGMVNIAYLKDIMLGISTVNVN
jgi:hypothetical protein